MCNITRARDIYSKIAWFTLLDINPANKNAPRTVTLSHRTLFTQIYDRYILPLIASGDASDLSISLRPQKNSKNKIGLLLNFCTDEHFSLDVSFTDKTAY